MNAHQHWSFQRITAVVMMLIIPYFSYQFFSIGWGNYPALAHLFSDPCNCALWLMLLGAILYHGYLGITVICTDYIRCSCVSRTLIFATQFVFVFFWLIAMFSLCKIIVMRSL